MTPAGLWLGATPVPDVPSKLPHGLPGLLFHDTEPSPRIVTSRGDLDDPKFLEAHIIRSTRRLAMADKATPWRLINIVSTAPELELSRLFSRPYPSCSGWRK
jgi:hypothetical protein